MLNIGDKVKLPTGIIVKIVVKELDRYKNTGTYFAIDEKNRMYYINKTTEYEKVTDNPS